MSFIQGPNNELVRDMWDDGLPRMLSNLRPMSELQVHEIVPLTIEQLYGWAYVRYEKARMDVTRRNLLLYSPSLFETNGAQQVVFRIQGFIAKYNLKPLGNWDLDEGSAHKALQYMTLHGGHDVVAFTAQCHALMNIREYILRVLGVRRSVGRSSRLIHLQRKVFTKATGASNQQNLLMPEDDPDGDAAAIGTKWVVSERASLATQTDGGILKRCSYLNFQRGDFVEVSIVADIVSRGPANARSTDVLFAFREIICLKSEAFQPRGRRRYREELSTLSGIEIMD